MQVIAHSVSYIRNIINRDKNVGKLLNFVIVISHLLYFFFETRSFFLPDFFGFEDESCISFSRTAT